MSRLNEVLELLNHDSPIRLDSEKNPYVTEKALYRATNRVLLWVIVLLAGLFIWQGFSMWQLGLEVDKPRLIVVRVNPDGQPTIDNWGGLAYTPQKFEMEYFLTEFTRWHYRRIRSVAAQDFERKIPYVDASYAKAWIESERTNKHLQKFLSGDGVEQEVYVKARIIEDLRQEPWKATVTFDLVDQTPDRRRRQYQVVYHFRRLTEAELERMEREDKGSVIAFLHKNPLALYITHFVDSPIEP
jgi:hypothetical protein